MSRAYIRQLALYRALLQRIYPGRTVRAALVYTENPLLLEIPQATLDAELAPSHRVDQRGITFTLTLIAKATSAGANRGPVFAGSRR